MPISFNKYIVRYKLFQYNIDKYDFVKEVGIMYLLLSADSYVGLYKVDKVILDNFDTILDDFFKWKKKNRYDETLFVKFIKSVYGDDSIIFKKVVGCYPEIENEYKNIKWFNF